MSTARGDDARQLADWLGRLEARNAARVELGLDRVSGVLARLAVRPPAGRVFTVAGTNGKGSTVGALDSCLRAAGLRTARYTSPHLCRYTERMHIDGVELAAGPLIEAFAAVEVAADGIPLTYFEFGTLAAFVAFTAARCDAWVLEVGLGGRLDAVNVLAPDFSLITTIGLDHEEYLGDTIEAIAGEKAGILRPGRPAFYGDSPVPAAIAVRAASLGAPLAIAGRDFGHQRDEHTWSFHSPAVQRVGIAPVDGWGDAQYRNASLALAALVAADPDFVPGAAALPACLRAGWPVGRFQHVRQGAHDWVLDVAHNPQAAAVLAGQLATLPPADTTAVVALLADKPVPAFVAALAPHVRRWVACGLDGPRGVADTALAAALRTAGAGEVASAASPAEALTQARLRTPAGGRVVVCGSFRLVGPALEWLGLYSAAVTA